MSLTFQELKLKLIEFWAEKGCIVHEGHDVEVGAGTFNPATFLRCLGPEPYKTVYIEPSRRPQDARYGENPNRVQCFHQLQVLIKPTPENIQQLYLESLEFLGLDIKKHDIRFVHDDWESPTLGAWGLGWEVWIDGMEVTQFTYFQSVGSQPLDLISVELTYGLERLCMYLQNVESIFDLKYNSALTYREVFHRNEVEWSHYNYSHASTDMWTRHFEDYEKETSLLLDANLPIPAYDFVMKASHSFNLLEARGVLSVTERTGYISRIRDLARKAASAYTLSRKELKHPLLSADSPEEIVSSSSFEDIEYNPNKADDFLLEIGSEELPASYILPALSSLEKLLSDFFKENSLTYENVETFGSPRRLSILFHKLKQGTPDEDIERKGPPVKVAFDSEGKFTPQGAGFFKSLKLDAATLEEIKAGKAKHICIKNFKNEDYLFANYSQKGSSTFSLLSKHLKSIIEKIHFSKRMRWETKDTYARPIHWLLALYDKHVIPLTYANIQSDSHSFGHRQRFKNGKIQIKKPSQYVDSLRKAKVMVDIEERRGLILEQLSEIENKLDCRASQKNALLAETAFLSEWPEAITGAFDHKFLQIPSEVIISEMAQHQKYFPLENKRGLMNQFVVISDNNPSELIQKGNEKVLTARLSDGSFLYKEDLATPLESYVERLKTVTFQKDLGTMHDKILRMEKHLKYLTTLYAASSDDDLYRACMLCKADLVTQLVYEFPTLQGIIGKHYALKSNENEQVAIAIQDHYLPKTESDNIPSTQNGTLLSLADKLDNLVGYFLAGLTPTSSSDPYALRRQTLSICKMLIEKEIQLPLHEVIENLSQNYPSHLQNQKAIDSLKLFIQARLKSILEEYRFAKDEIEASFSSKSLNPYDQYLKLHALHKFRSSDEFKQLYETYKRAKGQLKEFVECSISSGSFSLDAELDLFNHLQDKQPTIETALSKQDYDDVIVTLSSFQKPLNKLFSEVKILDDDLDIRKNRLGLLQEVFSLFGKFLDFSKIQEMKS